MKYGKAVFLCAFSAGAAASDSAHLQTTEPYRVRCRGIAVFAR